MTKPTDGPDRWADRLSDYLDGELPAAEAESLERHLAGCEACARALEELRAVVARARDLEPAEPPRDLWPEIAARIARAGRSAEAGEADGAAGALSLSGARRRRERRAGRRFTLSLPQLAAAAIALVALSGGGVWLATSAGSEGAVPGAAAGGFEPATGVTLATAAERPGPESSTLARYQAAIAELETAIFQEGERLDTATVQRIRESLRTIDRAIAEARRALREDPADAYVNQHLAETMRRKVEFLQQTAVLAVARE